MPSSTLEVPPDVQPQPKQLGAQTRILLEGPILPRLLRLAAPNIVVVMVLAASSTFDAWFVGRLGPDARPVGGPEGGALRSDRGRGRCAAAERPRARPGPGVAVRAAGADHLKALARVARQLRDPEIARRLRESSDADALYAVLAMPPASTAA